MQSFGPTSGHVTGWAGVVVAVVTAVLLAVQERSAGSVGVSALLLAAGVLLWCFLLRPRVLVGEERLVLRNALSEWDLPLAQVEGVVVRQTTAVATPERTYQGIGVGRPLRKVIKADRRDAAGADVPEAGTETPHGDVPDLLVQQVLARAEDARARQLPASEVRRTWAVPEIGVMGALVLVFLVSIGL